MYFPKIDLGVTFRYDIEHDTNKKEMNNIYVGKAINECREKMHNIVQKQTTCK